MSILMILYNVYVCNDAILINIVNCKCKKIITINPMQTNISTPQSKMKPIRIKKKS